MAEEYQVLLTNNGLDRLEQAMASGENLVVSHMVLGDAGGEPYTPTVTQEGLKNPILTKEISEALVSEGTVRFKSLLLSSDPSGDFLELGLLLDDGTLFAVANIPKLEHRQSDSGAVTESDISIVMVAENAQNVTINVSSDVYVSKDYANTYYLRTDGNNGAASDIPMGSHKLINLKAGSSAFDAAVVNQLLPIGSIYLEAGSVATASASNAKVCDGAEYPRTGETAALFKVIGTLFGRGNGTTTFNVPKLSAPFSEYADEIRYVIKYKY